MDRLPTGSATELGPGDDAAVVRAPDGRVVATTDLLVEGRHFRRDWSPAYDIGRKAAAQNLADIAAMGAVPTALLVGLAAPPDLDVAWCEDLADGLAAECATTGAAVVGGDVVGSGTVVVAVTALGDLQGRAPVTRAGARPGDAVVIVGSLGRAAAGLALLGAGDGLAAGYPSLVAAHRRPQPPYAAGPALADVGATSMIDISDGLLADLGHVADASGVRLVLDIDALPFDAEVSAAAGELGADALVWRLTGGEDHALVATVDPAVVVRLDGLAVVVGRVTEGSGVEAPGTPQTAGLGFDHFSGGPT